jgi:hypothetical protein
VGAVDRYLDELFDKLAGTGAAGRRTLAEAEDHLRAAAAEEAAAGLDQDAAEQAAVARFGPATPVAAGLKQAYGGIGALARQAFTGMWLVGSLGALAVGLSGLLAEAFGRLASPGFVSGDAAGVTYTPDRCADYYEYVPDARSCADAAAVHHWGEVVTGRVALGVLGLLALLALLAARRWTPLGLPGWAPPWTVVGAVLLALFGVAALGLGGTSLMELTFGRTDGVGANLSAGLVAAVAALAVTGWSLRRARRPA